MHPRIDIRSFYHEPTFTWSHLLWDVGSRRAAIVDPVLDYDAPSGRTHTRSAAGIMSVIEDAGLKLDWILETHAHADHLTAAQWFRDKTGARVAIGRDGRFVGCPWREVKQKRAVYPAEKALRSPRKHVGRVLVPTEGFESAA